MALPRNHNEIMELLRTVAVGINSDPVKWSNPPFSVAQINTQADDMELQAQNQTMKKAEAEQATALKKASTDKGSDMQSKLKAWAVSKVGANDPQLNELGFDGPAAPTPLQPPGQPMNLESCKEKGDGSMTLTWRKPMTGGKVAVYRVYRRDQGAASFVLIDTAAATAVEKALIAQPVGTMNTYQITAENDAGESPPSNMVESKL